MDALILVEAYLRNLLCGVARRPDAVERRDLIKSGSVIIVDQHDSGIKRWTDGRPWSPSRVHGNFILYHELERPWNPSRKQTNAAMGDLRDRNFSQSRRGRSSSQTQESRSLRGTVLASYPFKNGGLVKKAITISCNDRKYHVISYYSVDDALLGRLMTVRQDPTFEGLLPRMELLLPVRLRSDEGSATTSHSSSGCSSPLNQQVEAADVTDVPPLDLLPSLHNSEYYEHETHNLVRAGSEPFLSAPMPLEGVQNMLMENSWWNQDVSNALITSNPVQVLGCSGNEILGPEIASQNFGVELENIPYETSGDMHFPTPAQNTAVYSEFSMYHKFPGNWN
ncbi:Gti1/Pac2 family transporter [Metarhizium robertsii]|uniref:Gti1/Pac2 family transporter n=1 Tax=Metarhizium robertsii TaxID=568076 RepID=A0A014MUC1_9HYPO|nr:Gti1/Pac2 family transporter [Metarhizium robertsii]